MSVTEAFAGVALGLIVVVFGALAYRYYPFGTFGAIAMWLFMIGVIGMLVSPVYYLGGRRIIRYITRRSTRDNHSDINE